VVVGMTVPALAEGGASHTDGGECETLFSGPGAVLAFDLPVPAVDWESLSVPDLCEPALDDTSQDSMDDSHAPSQWVQRTSSCSEFSRVVGPLLNYAAETGLSTQMVCCVWRC
jgi:hypothetical protein